MNIRFYKKCFLMLPETLKPPEPQWRFGSHLEPEKKIFVVEGSSNLIAIKYPLRKVCSLIIIFR